MSAALYARPLVLAAMASMMAAGALAQEAVFAPPAAMVLDNVPPVPTSIATRLAPYGDFKSTGMANWHPLRREMIIVRRHMNTPQLFHIAKPGAPPALMTDYPEPVRGARFQPRHGQFYLFSKDVGGNEAFRTYRRGASGGEAVPITPDGQRAQGNAWSNKGDRLVYVTVPVNRQGSNDQIVSTVSMVDPEKPESARKLAELPGGGWSGFRFSPDDKQLVFVQYVSANESYLWLMDIASGKTRRLTDKVGDEAVFYGGAHFSRDGRGLYTVSDRGAEFKGLIHIDLATMKHTMLTGGINWDVELFDLSKNGKLLAMVINEDGMSVLKLMRTADHKMLTMPKLPIGTIGDLEWHTDSRNLGISLASATSPAEVYSIDVKTGKVSRWTTHQKLSIDNTSFVEPTLERWKSFDQRRISGFAYRAAPAKFPGKRPVLIHIHGGPEGQFQPSFQGRNNYYTGEMGVTVIFPNVRGSSGYGKTFLKLDNGRLREDSVRDIGALLDWIADQPDMDASRVAVTGSSYGGYMALAVATMYPERITAAIDVVGISNFVTFLERTESYRRDQRRVEYGDERHPAMRIFLESIAPLNNAGSIKKPLFVIQGKNDPRVPYQEADQIVATVKKRGVPVWYMTAHDEGHGFAKKVNADYQFLASIAFLDTYLVGK
ncbi:MAG: prolyl oligopeptidase family serine peptidase [Telluria sp.]